MMHSMKNTRITQAQIAKRSGVTQGFLSKYLSGKADPSVKTLKRISKATGIKISDLIELSSDELKKAFKFLEIEKEVA